MNGAKVDPKKKLISPTKIHKISAQQKKTKKIGDGLKHFCLHPYLKKMIHFDYITFSIGLKPPTRVQSIRQASTVVH